MKKNLQTILVVALGLLTTVSYAQDWGIDSRTRIDMSGDGDEMSTDQRVTLGAAVSGGSKTEGFNDAVSQIKNSLINR